MKYTHSDSKYDYFVSEFQGNQVRMLVNKKTQELLFNSDDVARSLGFEDMQDMLDKEPKAVNLFLDGMNNGKVKKI